MALAGAQLDPNGTLMAASRPFLPVAFWRKAGTALGALNAQSNLIWRALGARGEK